MGSRILTAKDLRGRRKRKVPPGQRLIRYFALALCLILSISIYLPAEKLNGQNETIADVPEKKQLQEPPFQLGSRLSELESRLEILGQKPRLKLGAFAIEPATGKHLGICEDESFAAASMIKVPVLVSLLKAIDRGEVSIDETLVLRPDLIGGGSGFLQWRPQNSKVSLKEAMETMIVFSDNTATNLIIDRLGGKDVCNRDFAFWNLKRTYIANWLPDLEGTNRTSPYDLCQILALVDKGEILSKESRKLMLATMEKTRIKTLLPAGLPAGTKISHKTGDIGSLVGDCGIISPPGGERLIACVQVARPHNDRRANELIRQVSREMYETFRGEQKKSGKVKTRVAKSDSCLKQ